MDKAVFKVWAKSSCPYCSQAQALLIENQLPHEVCLMDTQEQLLNEVQTKYNWSTVPVIVKQTTATETFIGGYTDLVEHLKSTGLLKNKE